MRSDFVKGEILEHQREGWGKVARSAFLLIGVFGMDTKQEKKTLTILPLPLHQASKDKLNRRRPPSLPLSHPRRVLDGSAPLVDFLPPHSIPPTPLDAQVSFITLPLLAEVELNIVGSSSPPPPPQPVDSHPTTTHSFRPPPHPFTASSSTATSSSPPTLPTLCPGRPWIRPVESSTDEEGGRAGGLKSFFSLYDDEEFPSSLTADTT